MSIYLFTSFKLKSVLVPVSFFAVCG